MRRAFNRGESALELEHEPLEQLRNAIANSDAQAVDVCLENLSPAESSHAVVNLSEGDQTRLLKLLSDQDAAEIVETLPEAHAAQLLEQMSPGDAAAIVSELGSDDQADMMIRLSDAGAEAILAEMKPADAAETRRLMQYSPETAGGLMVTEYLAYVENLRCEDVVNDMRRNAERYRDFDVQYAYVVSKAGHLRGVLRLRDLLLALSTTRIDEVMLAKPKSVEVDTPLEELERFFDHHQWLGVPVVEANGYLVGIVKRVNVEEAAEERSSRHFLKFMGIMGGEELRTMPLRLRSFRRLSWLSINIVLNIVAASVIAMHQDTLSSVIALAVFLPIISDMSGCSGNQAVAVSMRELSLGLIKPREFWRVFSKEAAVGTINGVVLGLLLGLVAFAWKGNVVLGAVVAIALAMNTLLAAVIGGTVPMLLRGLGQDPALASGPILTTITDMCGFLLVLSLASYCLPWLTV
ncbi:MAG: magnesium transporter [Planctomycetaceae bacterium]|nr:magnesium transporter [Planctomycetaceae bacterium]